MSMNLTGHTNTANLSTANLNQSAKSNRGTSSRVIAALTSQTKKTNKLLGERVRNNFSQINKKARLVRNNIKGAVLAQMNKAMDQFNALKEKRKASELLESLKNSSKGGDGEAKDEALSDADICLFLRASLGDQEGESGLQNLDPETLEAMKELSDELYSKNAEEVDAKDVLSFIQSTEDEEEKKRHNKFWWCDDDNELTEQEIILLLNLISLSDFMDLVKKGLLKLGSLRLYQRVVSYRSFQKDADPEITGHIKVSGHDEANQALAHKTMELSGASWLVSKIKRMYSSNNSLNAFEDEIKKELGEHTTFFIHKLASELVSLDQLQKGLLAAFKNSKNKNTTKDSEDISSVAQKKREEQIMAIVAKFVRSATAEYITESPHKVRNMQRLDAVMQQLTRNNTEESFVWRLA